MASFSFIDEDFEAQVNIIAEILGFDYDVVDEEVIFRVQDEWCAYNITTFDGTGEVKKDDEGYFIEVPITSLGEGDCAEDDVVLNGYWNEDLNWEDDYASVPEDNIIWVHEVHSGALALNMDTKEVYAYENTRYATPEAYVMKGGELVPLEVREAS